MAETLTIRTASSTEVIQIAVPGPQGPKGDKGDPGDVAGLPLTTLGDGLYRGPSQNERLPIGSAGQILKVSAGGIPEWGEAPATGVTSVSGTAPIVSSGGATPAISISAATTSADGSMSSADKIKLNGIATGAEVNVQANWTEASSASDAFIQNKPTLGTASTKDAPATGNASSTQVVLGNDTRLSDSRTPSSTLAHAASHAAAGSDPVFNQNLNTTDSPQFNQITASQFNGADTSGYDNSGSLTMLGALSGPAGSINTNGADYAGGGSINTSGGNYGSYGGSINTSGGSDIDVLGGSIDTSAGGGSINTRGTGSIGFGVDGSRTTLTGTATANRSISMPDASGTIALAGDAPASHTHGNLTNDGKIGSTAGLPVVTTTAGAVSTLALGAAGQVLTVNSGATGVEFADPAASGVTGAAASASDVLGVSGANITGVDANADRIVFWDDSASALKYLEAGSGLSISGTTLTATGGLNAMQSIAINFVLN